MNRTPWLVLAVALAGCGSSAKPPTIAPSGGTDDVTASNAPKMGSEANPNDDPRRSQIQISDEIKKACGIADADAYFDFDSANIRSRDSRVLGQLAMCFTSGPLARREMRLVGHADPRGEPEYNMLLAGRRADNVKEYIVKKGLDSGKVATTSRGEMDATGTSEESWPKTGVSTSCSVSRSAAWTAGPENRERWNRERSEPSLRNSSERCRFRSGRASERSS